MARLVLVACALVFASASASGHQAADAAGSVVAEELLEADALAEAIAAPILGAGGVDRSTPAPRLESGAGRKDEVLRRPPPRSSRRVGMWARAKRAYGFYPGVPHSLPFCLACLYICTCVPYFGVALLCDWADHEADSGKRFRKYKLQPHASPLSFNERWECWKVALINMGFWNALFGMGIAYPIWLARAPPVEFSLTSELPALLLAYPILTDLWFYAAHKMMHKPYLYRRVHKMHHRFHAPEAIAGVYCHPVEMVVVNAASMMIGPLVCGSHPYTWSIWGAIATCSVATSHSGYTSEVGGSFEHDKHHQDFSCNFGVALYLGDRIFGSFQPQELAPEKKSR